MQPNKSKATLQLVIATLLSLFGMLLLGAAFVTGPTWGDSLQRPHCLWRSDDLRRRPLRHRLPLPPVADARASPPASPTCHALTLAIPPDRHAPPAHHTRPLHTHLTTPYLLPFILYFYICTSPRPPAAHCDPILSTSLPPFRTASHPLREPSEPSSPKKFVLPPLKQAVTHLWKSFIPKEEEDLSSTSYPDDIVWITL